MSLFPFWVFTTIRSIDRLAVFVHIIGYQNLKLHTCCGFSLVTKHGQIVGRFIAITCIQFVHLVFFCTWTDEICLLIDEYFGDHKRSSKLWQPETVHALGMNTPNLPFMWTVKLCWPQNIQNWLSASYFLYMSFNSITTCILGGFEWNLPQAELLQSSTTHSFLYISTDTSLLRRPLTWRSLWSQQ